MEPVGMSGQGGEAVLAGSERPYCMWAQFGKMVLVCRCKFSWNCFFRSWRANWSDGQRPVEPEQETLALSASAMQLALPDWRCS